MSYLFKKGGGGGGCVRRGFCQGGLLSVPRQKYLYFSTDKDFSLFKWVYNDFMYVRFAGMRNTKTWSKSSLCLNLPVCKSLPTIASPITSVSPWYDLAMSLD